MSDRVYLLTSDNIYLQTATPSLTCPHPAAPSPPYLHGFHDVEVGHVLVDELGVLGHVDVFLGHHHALLKKELVDGDPVLLGHQHLNTKQAGSKH